jgi:hypothetical protein
MFTILLSKKRQGYHHSEIPTQHAEEKERRCCEKQGGTCSQREGSYSDVSSTFFRLSALYPRPELRTVLYSLWGAVNCV